MSSDRLRMLASMWSKSGPLVMPNSSAIWRPGNAVARDRRKNSAAEAIRRFGISGSIGIDLPTVADKAGRQAAAIAFDEILPQPFERTAVNGFGFLQIIRRRERASLIEIVQADLVLAAALALLRRAERTLGFGTLTLQANPAVLARIESRPNWIDALAQRLGAPVALRPDPALAISAGHASRAQN